MKKSLIIIMVFSVWTAFAQAQEKQDPFFKTQKGTSMTLLPTPEAIKMLGIKDAGMMIWGDSAKGLYQFLIKNGASEVDEGLKIVVRGSKIKCFRDTTKVKFGCELRISPEGEAQLVP